MLSRSSNKSCFDRAKSGAVVVNTDQTISIMINERIILGCVNAARFAVDEALSNRQTMTYRRKD